MQNLMAAAAAATTTTATSTHRSGLLCRSAVSIRRAEYRKLNRVLLAGALRTGDFLRLVQNDAFELRFTLIANIFVNGHGQLYSWKLPAADLQQTF